MNQRQIFQQSPAFCQEQHHIRIERNLLNLREPQNLLPISSQGAGGEPLEHRSLIMQRGDKAFHLRETLGRFVPDLILNYSMKWLAVMPEIVNQCKFDGIYF